ncbi:SUMF1/EgtB/PvdO family nonheme iron enzyme, partial [Candidatus Sumerlaeota bacterium]|nr:SUMF1/EgtB/PvdO family nonheme iron enzyme [Candidatus Sumerlaeota bacterium]
IPAESSLADKLSDAVPEHMAYLDAYYIDKFEVTNELYMKYVEKTGSKTPLFYSDPKFNDPKQPVVGVNYKDALGYLLWSGKRLPTEAEWEKAARGTDRRLYPWGNDFVQAHCNSYPNQLKAPVPVGNYPDGASPYGVMDMAGNVSEWVFDGYGKDYYVNSPYKNPQGPTETTVARIIRGGDYNSDSAFVSGVARFQIGEFSAFPNVGLRGVVSVEELEKLFLITGDDAVKEAPVSGITVISKEKTALDLLSQKESPRIAPSTASDSAFKKVRYFKNLEFDGSKCVGSSEIHRSRRAGAPYWKIYFHSPGKIAQAQYYDKREDLQLHIEPVYDTLGNEAQIKLYDNKGYLVYRSERVLEQGRPVKGILYSATGDYLGEEKF